EPTITHETVTKISVVATLRRAREVLRTFLVGHRPQGHRNNRPTSRVIFHASPQRATQGEDPPLSAPQAPAPPRSSTRTHPASGTPRPRPAAARRRRRTSPSSCRSRDRCAG